MSDLRIIPGSPDLVRFLAERFTLNQRTVLDGRDGDAVLASLEDSVRAAARSWCALDAGGPVLLLIATPLADFPGVNLWFVHNEAASRNMRGCIRLWRRAVAEMLSQFGAVRVDVPGWIPSLRRMARYGFTVRLASDPGSQEVGTYRCELTRSAASQDFRPYLPMMARA